jgi:acetyltransferase EpsM
MTPLLILGSGSFAIEALDIAEATGAFRPVGFVNSIERPASGARHGGLPVHFVDDIPFGPTDCVVVAGIVSTRRRAIIELLLVRGYDFATVVHPSAVISPRARLGVGCLVDAQVVVSHGAILGDHVILNRGCLIGHDNRMGSFTSVGPGANLAGAVEVGAGTYIGVGAVVRDHLTIGEGAVLGAGTVVIKPVPPHALVTGVPAEVKKTGVEGF